MTVGRPKGRSGAQTRERIVRAALRRFSKDGYHRAAVRDIARDVGVTDAAIFGHFGSKRGLLLAVFEQRGIPHALDVLESDPPSGPIDMVEARMERDARRLMNREAALIRLVTGEALRGDSDALAVYHDFMDRWTEVAAIALKTAGVRKPKSRAESFISRVFADFLHDVLLATLGGAKAKRKSRKPGARKGNTAKKGSKK